MGKTGSVREAFFRSMKDLLAMAGGTPMTSVYVA